MIPKQPPAPIEELPPEQKPEGDDVQWVPGYWAWDDNRNDFLWIKLKDMHNSLVTMTRRGEVGPATFTVGLWLGRLAQTPPGNAN